MQEKENYWKLRAEAAEKIIDDYIVSKPPAEKSDFWRMWGMDGKPAAMQRMAKAAYEAGMPDISTGDIYANN